MNARQKAKKYKRMYEGLLNSSMQYKIDTLRVEQFYPEAFITQVDGRFLREVIVRDLARDLVCDLKKYVDYHTEFIPSINKYRLYGEIKVIRKK